MPNLVPMRAFSPVTVRAWNVCLTVAIAMCAFYRPSTCGAAQPDTLPAASLSSAMRSQITRAFRAQPLRFEPNVGQVGTDVRFVARGGGNTTYLKEREATVTICPASKDGLSSTPVTMRLLGMEGPPAELVGENELPSRSNYFIGNDPSKWRTNVPQFSRVSSRSVYPGIDLVYYGQSQSEVEFDFLVQPGADPNRIRLGYDGVDAVNSDPSGALVLETSCGQVRQAKPKIFQDVAGARKIIDGDYVIEPNHEVRLRLGNYDHSIPLTIDPVIMTSSYIGGDQAEFSFHLAVDSAGNAFVTGYTSSASLPGITSGYQPTKAGNMDAFVIKVSGGGTVVNFSTYLGGAENDAGLRVTADQNGDIYVAGQAISNDFPVLNAVQPTLRGMVDGFLTKLGSNGDKILFSTYLGGDDGPGGSVSNDSANGLAVDSTGNAYVVLYTASLMMPHLTTSGVISSNLACSGCVDAYVVKLDPVGKVVYGTYFGARGVLPDDLAVDSKGSVYITGESTGNFGFAAPTPGAFTTFWGGGYDAVVAKINPTGTARDYATFLGGRGSEVGHGIVVDNAGSAYVVGTTFSANFPVVNAFQNNIGGNSDAFVTKLAPDGKSLVYSTFLGGDGAEEGRNITVDDQYAAYVVGGTGSIGFPVFKEFQGKRGTSDAFIVKLEPTGNKAAYSSFLGGEGSDEARGVAVSGKSVFIAGITSSVSFPIRQPFQATSGGGIDCFLTRLGEPGYFLR